MTLETYCVSMQRPSEIYLFRVLYRDFSESEAKKAEESDVFQGKIAHKIRGANI